MRRLLLILLFICSLQSVQAQKVIFEEHFKDSLLQDRWQGNTGNWHIDNVEDRRIAPIDKEINMLCSGGTGSIRLSVNIPDSIKAKKIILSFYYYTYSKGPAGSLDLHFLDRNLKNGHKGSRWKANLPVIGRWHPFRRTITVPAAANNIELTFKVAASSTSKSICFDMIKISAIQ
jgi:hypothetical protein